MTQVNPWGTTFRSLEAQSEINYDSADSEGWPLQTWYDSVRDIPINELSAGDLATALRQDIFLSAVIPATVTMLEDDPCSGEQFDGELAWSLKFVKVGFWKCQPEIARRLCGLIEEAIKKCGEELGDDLVAAKSQISACLNS